MLFEYCPSYRAVRFTRCPLKRDSTVFIKSGSRLKNLCMARVLSFLIKYFSNYFTLHRSDLAARAAPLDPRLFKSKVVSNLLGLLLFPTMASDTIETFYLDGESHDNG